MPKLGTSRVISTNGDAIAYILVGRNGQLLGGIDGSVVNIVLPAIERELAASVVVISGWSTPIPFAFRRFCSSAAP